MGSKELNDTVTGGLKDGGKGVKRGSWPPDIPYHLLRWVPPPPPEQEVCLIDCDDKKRMVWHSESHLACVGSFEILIYDVPLLLTFSWLQTSSLSFKGNCTPNPDPLAQLVSPRTVNLMSWSSWFMGSSPARAECAEIRGAMRAEIVMLND